MVGSHRDYRQLALEKPRHLSMELTAFVDAFAMEANITPPLTVLYGNDAETLNGGEQVLPKAVQAA